MTNFFRWTCRSWTWSSRRSITISINSDRLSPGVRSREVTVTKTSGRKMKRSFRITSLFIRFCLTWTWWGSVRIEFSITITLWKAMIILWSLIWSTSKTTGLIWWKTISWIWVISWIKLLREKEVYRARGTLFTGGIWSWYALKY